MRSRKGMEYLDNDENVGINSKMHLKNVRGDCKWLGAERIWKGLLVRGYGTLSPIPCTWNTSARLSPVLL